MVKKHFSRSYLITRYAVASVIFFPLAALCFPSFMFKLYALLGVISLVSDIYGFYKGKQSKSILDLIETLIENPKEFGKELSLLKPILHYQGIAVGAFFIFSAVVSYTVSNPEIFIQICAVICIFSIVVELIKDIALPSSKLKNASDENALIQANEHELPQHV